MVNNMMNFEPANKHTCGKTTVYNITAIITNVI